MMNKDHQRSGDASAPGTRRKPVPIAMATGPAEYTAGQQEMPIILTSLAEMLHWAQNWARSRSIWPFSFGLACCDIEMIAAASAENRKTRSETRRRRICIGVRS
jgi:NADH-quinone oxidoreductase subunit B